MMKEICKNYSRFSVFETVKQTVTVSSGQTLPGVFKYLASEDVVYFAV